MPQDKLLEISSSQQINYCPKCGKETESKEFPVRSNIIEGEEVVTKSNLEISCPEHGVITVNS